jgi:hypothetical protein
MFFGWREISATARETRVLLTQGPDEVDEGPVHGIREHHGTYGHHVHHGNHHKNTLKLALVG